MLMGAHRTKPNYNDEPLLIGLTPHALHVLRAAYGWTQEDLAIRSGISVDNIKKIENGNRLSPGKPIINALEKAFHVKFLKTF